MRKTATENGHRKTDAEKHYTPKPSPLRSRAAPRHTGVTSAQPPRHVGTAPASLPRRCRAAPRRIRVTPAALPRRARAVSAVLPRGSAPHPRHVRTETTTTRKLLNRKTHGAENARRRNRPTRWLVVFNRGRARSDARVQMLPLRVCCPQLCAMPVQHLRVPE